MFVIMKKIFTLAVLFAAVAMVSCGGQNKKANNAEEQVATKCCAEEAPKCEEACCAECDKKENCAECTEKKECCKECAEAPAEAEACCAECADCEKK